MGKKFVLVGDLGTDHEGFPPTPVLSGSPNVYMDGKPMARVGDPLAPHAKPHHPPHPRTITSGEPRFIINGMEAAVTGGTISCDGVTIGTGSGEVNGFSSAAAFSSGAAISPDADSGAGKQSLTNNTAASYASAAATQLTETRSPTPAEPDLPNTDVRKRSERLASQANGSGDSPANKSSDTVAGTGEEPAGQSPKPQKPVIRVEAGIFFDGTGNNRNNTASFEKQVDDCLSAHAAGAVSEAECSSELSQVMEGSSLNADTNVSKLERLYLKDTVEEGGEPRHRLSVYVSGVGTQSGAADSGWSMGTGLGERGILEKVATGSGSLTTEISRRIKSPINELIIDVFGFSRGAATARHFVNEIKAGPQGALGKAFINGGIAWPRSVTVRFLGIFDTVAAVIGAADLESWDFSAHNASNGPVNTDISAGDVQRAVHFVAKDERRANFSLNSLRAKNGSLPGHFSEWSLPGAHSDIGGGYQDQLHERIEVIRPLQVTGKARRHPESSNAFTQLLHERALIKSEGWIGSFTPMGELDIEQSRPPRLPGGNVTLRLWLDRSVRGEYSLVPLYLMHKLATDEGVPLDAVDPKDKDLSLPQELIPVARNLASHVWHGQSLLMAPESRALLRQRYTHHSDHYLAIGPVYPFRPAPNGRRAIYPNKGLA